MAINQNFLVRNGLSVGSGGTYLISSGSSFGIGTTTPSSALQVVGTVTGTTFSGSGSLLTSIPNSALNNSSITINTGTGLSGGGTIGLGSTITIFSTGMTSIIAGSGISVSSSGSYTTIYNTGVTSLASSGIGISISGSTGNVTISSGATSVNTVNTIVSRDASGNFSAGTITANLIGSATTSTNLSGGTVTVSAGTTAAPSIAFTGSTGTGLYLPSTNIFAISTGSTERIRFDNSGNVGINTTTPLYRLDINSTDAIRLPIGGTSQRPTGTAGLIRYNSDSNQFEGYGTAWGSIGGGAAGGGGDRVFYENDSTITTSYTITATRNAITGGPITINSGAVVTIPDSSTWTIV